MLSRRTKIFAVLIGILYSGTGVAAVELVGPDASPDDDQDLPSSFQALDSSDKPSINTDSSTAISTDLSQPSLISADLEPAKPSYPSIRAYRPEDNTPSDWRLKRKVRQALKPQLVHNFKPGSSDDTQTTPFLKFDTNFANQRVYSKQGLVYPEVLESSYALSNQAMLWTGNDQAGLAFNELQWQLLTLSLAGADAQFGTWLALTQNHNNPEQLELVASDASLGLKHYYQQLQNAPYASQMSLQILRDISLNAPAAGLELSKTSEQALATLQQQAVLSSDINQRFRSEISQLLQDHADTPWPRIERKPMIKPGVEDPRVIVIREQLARLDYPAIGAQLGTYYDKELAQQVAQFQSDHGLKEDGIIGPQTISWLNRSPLYRAKIIARNQLRMQLFGTLDPKVDQALLVNLPGYELEYISPVQDNFRSRVIVGRLKRQTPLLQGQISSIVVNPPWHVPSTLVEKDLLPKVRKDPNYILDKHYELLSYDGKKVAPQSIDVQALQERGEFPYRMRQKPGPWNALGAYKFHFDNSQAIFLHDTASPSLFNRDLRNLSSGCIRVEQSDLLAQLLLEQRGIHKERREQYLLSGDTKWLSLKQTTPVYFLYLTAWFDEDSKITYRDDIYLYDNDLKYSVELNELIMGLQSAQLSTL